MAQCIFKKLYSRHAFDLFSLNIDGRFHCPWSKNSIEEELKHPNHMGLGVWLAGNMAGFLFARREFGENWLLMLGVAQQYQNLGIGKGLLSSWVNSCPEKTDLWLEVHEENQAAIHLYLKCGFELIQKRPRYYPEPNGRSKAALVMRLSTCSPPS